MNRETLKKLLYRLNETDYVSNIDLHIHSNESDGEMPPLEILKQAKTLKKQYISIVDHNTAGAYSSKEIKEDDIIIPGIEFDCYHNGIYIHIIGYGIDINDDGIKSLYATKNIGRKLTIYRICKLRNAKDTISRIKNSGGIAVLAHPACYPCFNLDGFVKSLVDNGLDGLEVYYPYNGLRRIVKFHSKNEVKKIAEKHNLIMTGGSDIHGKKL